MSLLASLFAALAAVMLVLTVTGRGHDLRLRLPRQRSRRSKTIWLRQADLPMTAWQYATLRVAVALFVVLLCWGASGSPLVGLVPGTMAGVAVNAAVARRRSIRLSRVAKAWPDGIRFLLVNIEARLSLHDAMAELARSGPVMLRTPAARYIELAGLLGSDAALVRVRDELADPVSDRVFELLRVANESGTDLAVRVLREQAEQVEADQVVTAELATAALEPKLTARAAAIIPWVLLVLLCAVVAAYADFYSSPAGLAVCLVAGGMGCCGLAIGRRLSREHEEPRVVG